MPGIVNSSLGQNSVKWEQYAEAQLLTLHIVTDGQQQRSVDKNPSSGLSPFKKSV